MFVRPEVIFLIISTLPIIGKFLPLRITKYTLFFINNRSSNMTMFANDSNSVSVTWISRRIYCMGQSRALLSRCRRYVRVSRGRGAESSGPCSRATLHDTEKRRRAVPAGIGHPSEPAFAGGTHSPMPTPIPHTGLHTHTHTHCVYNNLVKGTPRRDKSTLKKESIYGRHSIYAIAI